MLLAMTSTPIRHAVKARRATSTSSVDAPTAPAPRLGGRRHGRGTPRSGSPAIATWVQRNSPSRSERPPRPCRQNRAISGIDQLRDHPGPPYIELKREEWLDYRVQVTARELDRYLAVT